MVISVNLVGVVTSSSVRNAAIGIKVSGSPEIWMAMQVVDDSDMV